MTVFDERSNPTLNFVIYDYERVVKFWMDLLLNPQFKGSMPVIQLSN